MVSRIKGDTVGPSGGFWGRYLFPRGVLRSGRSFQNYPNRAVEEEEEKEAEEEIAVVQWRQQHASRPRSMPRPPGLSWVPVKKKSSP